MFVPGKSFAGELVWGVADVDDAACDDWFQSHFSGLIEELVIFAAGIEPHFFCIGGLDFFQE